jgi:hypothetical protein
MQHFYAEEPLLTLFRLSDNWREISHVEEI